MLVAPRWPVGEAVTLPNVPSSLPLCPCADKELGLVPQTIVTYILTARLNTKHITEGLAVPEAVGASSS